MKYAKANVISIKFNVAEKIQDCNCEALASEKQENRLLKALENIIEMIDLKDNVLGNEPEIEQAKKLIGEAREQNEYQFKKDHQEQLILDNVVPMFPEHCIKKEA